MDVGRLMVWAMTPAQLVNGGRARGRLAPHGADAAASAPASRSAGPRGRAARRSRRSTASSGSRVTPSPATTICRSVSRLVARKSSDFAHADPAAHLERLVAQAMAILEQQQRVARADPAVLIARACSASGCLLGSATVKASSYNVARLEARPCGAGKRDDADVDFTVAQPLQQRLGLVFVEHQAEMRAAPCGFFCMTRGNKYGPIVGISASLSFPANGSVLLRASAMISLLSSSMRRARTTICLPTSVKLHVLRPALDQFHAEIVLELLQLRGKRRLADEGASPPPCRNGRYRRARRGI